MSKVKDYGELVENYSIEADMSEKTFMLTFYDDDGDPVCTLSCEPEEGYLLASRILRAYDELEGIK